MKTLMTTLLVCLVCTSAFAGRDDLIIYKTGAGKYVQTQINNHCVDNGYIRPKNKDQAIQRYCNEAGYHKDKKEKIKNCDKDLIITEILKRHMYLKETIDLGSSRAFTRYYRDVHVSKRSFPDCKESIIEVPHQVHIAREATMQERLFYGALYQSGIKTIMNETISPKQASEGRWGEAGDTMRSIMIHYDTPNCNAGNVDESNNSFRESDFFRMGGEGSGSGRIGGEGSGSGHLGGEGSGSGHLGGEGSGSGYLGGEGSGSGRAITRVNVTPHRINTLRITPNYVERQLGIKPIFATYLTGEEEIPRSVMGVKCQKK